MKIAKKQNGSIRVEFRSYDKDEFYDLVNLVKPMGKFDKREKAWFLSLNRFNYLLLRDNGFVIEKELSEKFEKREESQKYYNPKLYDFQNEDLNTLISLDGNALLAHEMGLGKTIISICYAEYSKSYPALVICPASVKYQWQDEMSKWANKKSAILYGKTAYSIPKADVVIINYDIVHHWVDVLIDYKFKFLILDESTNIKNAKAFRTQAVLEMSRHIQKKACLSGTPIENRPIELYTTLKIINPGLFPSWFHYANRYCGLRKGRFGYDTSGSANTEELNHILTNSIMLRRKKRDVLKDLPAKLEENIPIEISNKKTYEKAENDFISYLRDQGKTIKSVNILTKLTELRQLTARGKLSQGFEFIEDTLNNVDKLIVFCIHQKTVEEIADKFKNISVKYYGKSTDKEKKKATKEFRDNKKIKLFVGNIQSAGMGLNLQFCTTQVFMELPYKPSALAQAQDRSLRIGTKSTVNIYNLIGKETIDERMIRMIYNKKEIIDKIIDGKKKEDVSVVDDLIKELRGKGD